MTLAIKIGAGSKVYDDISIAYAMRGNQKLSITGSGADLYAKLGTLTAKADGISGIKATSDIVVSAQEVSQNKAALLKLGTKSLVLQNSPGTESYTNFNTYFKDLDSVYTKFKALNVDSAPNIDITKLSGAVNLVGMENLSGKVFTVTGTGADLKANINAVLKNINQISQINLTGGSGGTQIAELTADQLRIIGDKIHKDAGNTVLLRDTASNLLTTDNLELINKYNNTNLNPASRTIAAATSATGGAGGTVVTSSAHGLNTGDAVTFQGTASGNFSNGYTYYVRKLTNDTFSLYDSNQDAVNTSSYTGLRSTATPASVNIVGTFSTTSGALPNRVTVLDDVQVTAASVAQVQRFDALTTLNTGASPNRPIPNIISKIDIADSVEHLTSNVGVTQAMASASTGASATTTAGLITIVGHGYNTGDAVTYNVTGTSPAAMGGLSNNGTYYVGKVSADTFALFQNKAAAVAATANLLAGTDTSHLALTTAGSGDHSFTVIPTGGEIAQTMTSVVAFTATTGSAAAGDGVITLTGHGYKTGDAVTYSTTGTAMTASGGNLVNGSTYYVGKIATTDGTTADNDHFVLFTTRAAALAANLNTAATAFTSGGYKVITSAGSGEQKFTSSQLDQTMSAVGRMKDGTGQVGRVTILGQGAINVADLNRIAKQANRGEGDSNNAYVAYSALGVDVNKNLQALYDNKTAGTAIDEIVVSDGTSTGKKAIALTNLMYGALKNLFSDGVDHPQGAGTNKNYAFTVSGATFGSAATLQSDANVATYAITGATYNDLTNPNTALATVLGRSKLKTLTSVSISDPTQRTTITTLLNALGNPVDRAKLKLTA